ncbi:MAG TPA: bifunctional lysine ketoglutarate reductase /saccharopine dehydrogenase family protein [Candidatus Eremiobacteraeota bacterium]|nr:MAG: hypothetical protein BWY64_02159 [bacterium ADurb.Bin363]HPZ08087.1 bifunctional lysine ketoglutarate reductase /saccharopine dehydrogenase family protein [Candidatus Eremiobacteraeota bacterium]
MKIFIGIRREDKNIWESRTPLTPEQIKELSKDEHIGFIVQKSKTRAYSDNEYEKAGALVQEDLSPSSVVLAIKEIPIEFFQPKKTYIFFSHTIKGQKYNMPMLKRMMDLQCTLIDYEKIVDDKGRRLLFFGNYAGYAGMIDTLWALGQRLHWEGISTPFSTVKHCYKYKTLEKAKEAIKEIGLKIKKEGLSEKLCPLVVAFAGYGNVSRGAQEILNLMPFIEITPEELLDKKKNSSKNHIYKVVFKEEHMYKPKDKEAKFNLEHYYSFPENYESIFERYIPFITVLINCIYWDKKYPPILTKEYLKNLYKNSPVLRVVGDISCDINGAIECTVKPTSPSSPVFVYDPLEDKIADGYEGRGPVIMAIDNLPCELPLESSSYFGEILKNFVPEIARADYSVDFEECSLSSPIKNAVIVYQGKLTPNYNYLEKFL